MGERGGGLGFRGRGRMGFEGEGGSLLPCPDPFGLKNERF